jgi:transcriptional regulator with XRE-family HTH domain
MEESRLSSGIGDRIRKIRKARGIKSTAELAALIPGNLMSGAVLRNIEAGTKADLAVSELLNISRALNVSPIFLLAPIREPGSTLDLPNLSEHLSHMTALEFDEWLSTTSDAIRDWTTPEEHSERSQLRALRELRVQTAERHRLSRLIELASEFEAAQEYEANADVANSRALRMADTDREIERLTAYLRSAGWDIPTTS